MNDASALPVLSVAVVGHTNTGKTSLLRTLLRDVDFGEVSSTPGTTRDVVGCALIVNGREVVKLYDTPGLEDSIGLLEEIESNRVDHRADGLQLVEQFLRSPAALDAFAQEAKALRSILECDAVLYVVDARDPVLAKNRDELRILGYCAKPVMPVLNFIANEHARTPEWREQLARVNMHAVAEFDTVVLESDGERRLFEKIETLLDGHRPTIRAFIESRRRERKELIDASSRLIAELLIDAAVLSLVVDVSDREGSEEAMERLKTMVRDAEKRAVADLLELHRFRESDYVASPLPVEEGTWGRGPVQPGCACGVRRARRGRRRRGRDGRPHARHHAGRTESGGGDRAGGRPRRGPGGRAACRANNSSTAFAARRACARMSPPWP